MAIKIIDRANVGKDYEKNLKMEMEILQRVHHPNIISLYEMIEEGNKLYFVMELYVTSTKCIFVFAGGRERAFFLKKKIPPPT